MKEYIRKFIHILFGSLILVGYFYTNTWTMIVAMLISLAIGLILSKLIEQGRNLGFINDLVKHSEREDEKHFVGKGAVLFFSGFLLTLLLDFFWINDTLIILASLAILVYGDGFSAIVGRILGEHKVFGNQTLEGSATFLLVAFIFVNAITGDPGKAVLIGIIAALTELVPLNDNLTIPVVSAVALKLFV